MKTKKNLTYKLLASITAAALILSLTACSPKTMQTNKTCAQLSGIWIIQDEIDDSQCGGQGRTEHHRYTVTQNNCQLTIAETGVVGFINGNQIHWPSYSMASNGGKLTIPESLMTVKDKNITSTVHWTWNNGNQQCSGNNIMTGSMDSQENEISAKVDNKKWTGTWNNKKQESIEIIKIDKQHVLFNYYWAADPASAKAAGSALIKGDRQAGKPLVFSWQIPNDGKLTFSLNKAKDKLTATYENGPIYGINEMTQGSQSKLSKYSKLLSPYDGAIESIFSVHAANAKQVYLAGEMTDWQGDILKMSKGDNGVWVLPLYLAEGAWQYKFVIDGKWQYDKTNPNTTDDGFQGLNSIIVLGEDNIDAKATENIAHGSVQKVEIQSQALAAKSPFMIYLPPNYKQNTQTHYPLLFLLHGYGNDDGQWTRDGKIQHFMDNYLAEGLIKPFIIVMPSGATSWYMDKYETHIIKEVKDYVDSHYRVKTGKSSTAISGMSMGGFGAFYLALRHPEQFGLSVPLSGYYNMSLYPELALKAKSEAAPELHFYCGKDDTTSFSSNQILVKKLKQDGVNFTYKTAPGGHTWRYWNGITKDMLKVVSDYFDKS